MSNRPLSMDLRRYEPPDEHADDPVLKHLAAKRNRIVRAGRGGNFNARKAGRLARIDAAAQFRIAQLRAEAQKPSPPEADPILEQLNPNQATYLREGT